MKTILIPVLQEILDVVYFFSLLCPFTIDYFYGFLMFIDVSFLAIKSEFGSSTYLVS
jgi:hypothetical protein